MMNLERADLLQLVPLSHRGTLKLLPLGKKNKQKLLVGDDSGQIGCYEFKNGERQVVFMAKPFEGPVTSVELGGNPKKRDKIFLSHSQRIVGYTKKGKEFFKLTSTLTETIQNIAIEDTRIWTGCEYIHNVYDNGKEVAYFNSLGQINHLFVSHLTRENEFDTILSCQDKFIRVLHGSQAFIEIPLNHPVLCAAHLDLTNDTSFSSKQSRPHYLVFGTSKGTLGMIQISSTGDYQLLWELEDGDKRSAVNSLKLYDLNKDHVSEIIIGRDDGRIEVYKIYAENMSNEPARVFSKDIGESIRSVECGVVCTPDYPEIIIAAYSGKIISFTTEPIRSRAVEDNYGRSIQTVNNENRIKTLRKEVEDLRKSLEKEREKLKKANINTSELAAMKPPLDFAVNAIFDLDVSLAAYSLSVELQTPIDMIILRSPVVLDFLDMPDMGNSVLSISAPQHGQQQMPDESDGRFVAVWRCQSQQRRMNLLIRTNEGEYGDLHLTIVAAVVPKAAKVIKYELKPLSLHTKVYELTEQEQARPRSSIRYTGTMGFSTIHEWMQTLFPDIPPRLDEQSTNERYFFRNTFTQAVTVCDFRANEIVIESECASTIAIAKETITRVANYRRVNLQEYVNAVDASLPSFLSLMRDRLEYQISLARKMQLVDAIQELVQQDENPSWLSEEYQMIIRDQEIIRNAFKNRDRSLDYLSGIITDLFVDWNRLQGHDVKHKIPQLHQLIMTSDYNQIVKFIQSR